jgi:hypothetical protein
MLPDFYNPIYYSIIKRKWLIREFSGIENIQINHSQLHQDIFVLSILDGKENGTYIEVGGHEPIFINNSYLLENTFGWRGFSIELDSSFVERHKKLRGNICYCLDATKADYKQLIEKSGMGNVIDYLSIDTDPPNVTLAALKRIPHDKYKFRVITFEHDYSAGGVLVREESRKYLFSLGYQLVVNDISWGNRIVEDWWVHPDLTDKSIVNQMLCIDENIHEHNKYIYNQYQNKKVSQ